MMVHYKTEEIQSGMGPTSQADVGTRRHTLAHSPSEGGLQSVPSLCTVYKCKKNVLAQHWEVLIACMYCNKGSVVLTIVMFLESEFALPVTIPGVWMSLVVGIITN